MTCALFIIQNTTATHEAMNSDNSWCCCCSCLKDIACCPIKFAYNHPCITGGIALIIFLGGGTLALSYAQGWVKNADWHKI